MDSTHTPPVAVIDIGSNNVRMVVYAGALPLHILYLEGMRCGLGQDLSHTGVLYGNGAAAALEYIPYLYRTAKNMGCRPICAVATAALRNASDCRQFLARLKRKCPLHIRVISGTEEARLSALGAMHQVDNPSGIVADLGGGSMDIAGVQGDKIFAMTSIPIGALSLNKYPPLCEVKPLVKAQFKQHFCNKTFADVATIYVVGGILRALMSQYMYDTVPHMQRVTKSDRKQKLQGFTVASTDMMDMVDAVLKKRRSVYTMPDLGNMRYPYATLACYMLKQLIKKSKAPHITACTGGLRDGVFLDLVQSGCNR